MSRPRRTFTPQSGPPRKSSPLAFGDVAQQWMTSQKATMVASQSTGRAAAHKRPSVLGNDKRWEHLTQLWNNWKMVMGAELAPLAHPLGHREGILLVGVEDHFLMQELSYAVPEMLERVNAFMDEAFFQKIELHLLGDRVPLNEIQATTLPPLPPPERPKQLGGLHLDPNTTIGRCYAAYVKVFEDNT